MPSECVLEAAGLLEETIARATGALRDRQHRDGHWAFELEADATIPGEYVLLEHYLDRIDGPLQQRIGRYLRRTQGADGGWPLFYGGAFDLSASVKAYFALKCIGDDQDLPHMARARQAILAAGGASRSNVFTRMQLALFGEVPWRAVPVMPVEIMLLPKWFFFHLSKVSYWSRTVMVPLLVLAAHRPLARNPNDIHVRELFVTPPELERHWTGSTAGTPIAAVFKMLDQILQLTERFFPRRSRRRATDAAVTFVRERLNGEDGLGGIYPAMANTVMMFDLLGYEPSHPDAALAWRAVRKLLVVHDDEAYCQPCLSPVWDTGLSGHAAAEAGLAGPTNVTASTKDMVDRACQWLLARQITEIRGDWAVRRPDLPPGGWAFQYANDYFPDVDDTAVVGMLLHRSDDRAYAKAIARARDWIIGMQSRDGGWGAFEPENTHMYLNAIPFADHGALLDPPTADVTARCVAFLAQIGLGVDHSAIERGVAYLRSEQEPDGSWFGRWGTNHIYGTWSALCALSMVGLTLDDDSVRRGTEFLLATQRDDGGWGEDEETYRGAPHGLFTESTPSQTAWALIGLMAAGCVNHPAVGRGILYLQQTQRVDGDWDELPYTAVGFPRVFYLRYHGYRLFFPLLALARYQNLLDGKSQTGSYGF